jgi:hypothetical protein
MRYKRFKFKHKETIVTILAENEKYYEIAINAILEARRAIENKIKDDPIFLITYEPYKDSCEKSTMSEHEVVRRMVEAANVANVGPMAAVAGTIASFAVESMVEEGARFALVDNGGDIVMYSHEVIKIALYTGNPLDIGFKMNPGGFYSVCTSSGTVGHSVSLGFADAVTVFSKNASLSDAFATRIGNEIKENYGKIEIQRVLEKMWDFTKEHIDGIFVVKGDIIGQIGKVPTVIRTKFEPDLITKG